MTITLCPPDEASAVQYSVLIVLMWVEQLDEVLGVAVVFISWASIWLCIGVCVWMGVGIHILHANHCHRVWTTVWLSVCTCMHIITNVAFISRNILPDTILHYYRDSEISVPPAPGWVKLRYGGGKVRPWPATKVLKTTQTPNDIRVSCFTMVWCWKVFLTRHIKDLLRPFIVFPLTRGAESTNNLWIVFSQKWHTHNLLQSRKGCLWLLYQHRKKTIDLVL